MDIFLMPSFTHDSVFVASFILRKVGLEAQAGKEKGLK